MFGHAAYLNRLHSILASNSSEKRPNPLFDPVFDPWLPIFRAENKMIMKGGKCIGHDGTLQIDNEISIVAFGRELFGLASRSESLTVAWDLSHAPDRRPRRIATVDPYQA